MDDRRDSVGPLTDARQGIAWKTYTRVRWARLDSLKVVVNCGHTWCFRDSRVLLPGFTLVRLYIDSNICDRLKNG
jgi:hypothetical protein